jgi:hypothetical protein
MNDVEHTPGMQSPPGGRIPSGPQAEAIHLLVAEVIRVLRAAQMDSRRDGASELPYLVNKFGGQVEAGMLALGDALADFLDEPGGPADLDALRSEFLEPIISLSRSLPVFNRAEAWRRNKEKTVELHELVLAGQVVGFDAETRLLDNFYENTVYANAIRSRIAAIVDLAASGMERRRRRTSPDDLRALVIGANSVPPARSPFVSNALIGRGHALIVDGDAQALRLARQRYQDAFGIKADVLRVRPESLAKNLHAIGAPFHVVYTLMGYDLISPQAALAFTRTFYQVLRPGGALVTGCFLPSVPRSYRALAMSLMDLAWQHWDEAMWREMLGQLPFDLSTSRFETVEPDTLIVLARRGN